MDIWISHAKIEEAINSINEDLSHIPIKRRAFSGIKNFQGAKCDIYVDCIENLGKIIRWWDILITIVPNCHQTELIVLAVTQQTMLYTVGKEVFKATYGLFDKNGIRIEARVSVPLEGIDEEVTVQLLKPSSSY